MERIEIVELLKKGFNAEMLANALNTSVSHVNELKRKPVENEVYHFDDINGNAIVDFAEKHKIDIQGIDWVTICQSRTSRQSTKVTLEVGLYTPFGNIVEIINAGSHVIYKCQDGEGNVVYKYAKDLKDAIKDATNLEVVDND